MGDLEEVTPDTPPHHRPPWNEEDPQPETPPHHRPPVGNDDDTGDLELPPKE